MSADVDAAREALLAHWFDPAKPEPYIDAFEAAIRAECEAPSDALRAHWGEGYRQGKAESAETLRALREALATIQDICKPTDYTMSGPRWDGGAGGNKQRIWLIADVALEAAIRAECETAEGRLLDEALSTLRAGTLDVERLTTAMDNVIDEYERNPGFRGMHVQAAAIAAEYDRLAGAER